MGEGLLIYGANGYTGELVARRAVECGLRPTLAGRNGEAVAALAEHLGLAHLAVSLDDPAGLDAALRGQRVVLHCAGPFRHTSSPMVEACLRAGVHYLDITGELAVFESLYGRDAEARAAGVTLLPGVGFDIVPTDCLAAHLKRRLPGARRLELAFRLVGRPSRGTAITAIEGAASGAVRRGGKIVRVAPGHVSRRVDFGRGPVTVVAIPWGDVSTAYYSTGIPDITVYSYVPPLVARALRAGRLAWPVLAWRPVRELLRWMVRRQPPGPTDAARARGLGLVWGEARDGAGSCVASRLRTPEGYTFTALAAVLIAEKTLAGAAPTGFQTPSLAFGPDLVLEIPGVEREDLAGEDIRGGHDDRAGDTGYARRSAL